MYGIVLKGCITWKAEHRCVSGTSGDWSVSKVCPINTRTSVQIRISNEKLGMVMCAHCPGVEGAGPDGSKAYWSTSLEELVSSRSQLRDFISKIKI